MANKTELGYGEESDKEAMKNNDKLIRQLQKDLEDLRKQQAGKK